MDPRRVRKHLWLRTPSEASILRGTDPSEERLSQGRPDTHLRRAAGSVGIMSGSTSSSPRGDAQHAGSRSASVDAASPSGSHDEKNDLKKGAAMEHTLHHRRQPPSAEIEHAPGAFEHGPGNPMRGPGTAADTAVDTPYPRFASDLPWSARTWYYQLMPFRGMYYDLRRRLPFFVTDWTTAFKPDNWWTVAQYVVRMYFINLMPAMISLHLLGLFLFFVFF